MRRKSEMSFLFRKKRTNLSLAQYRKVHLLEREERYVTSVENALSDWYLRYVMLRVDRIENPRKALQSVVNAYYDERRKDFIERVLRWRRGDYQGLPNKNWIRLDMIALRNWKNKIQKILDNPLSKEAEKAFTERYNAE
jgi:hypothetical protein